MRPAHPTRSRPSSPEVLLLLLLASIAGGVLAQEAARAPESVSSMGAQEVATLALQVAPIVEEIRGAKFKSPVPVKVVGDAAAQEHFNSRIKKFYSPQQLLADQTAYVQLGLLPPSTDMVGAVMKVMEEQAGGFYDPGSGIFYVLGDMPRSIAPAIVAHELTHALDDQRFDIDGMLERAGGDNDRLSAAASVIEGSGTVVMTAYVLRQMQSGAMASEDMEELQQTEAGRAQKLLAAPPLIQRWLVGPYMLGQYFITHGEPGRVTAGVNGAEIDELFLRPPLSTEQVIHPEKYWDASRRDLPRAVALPDLSALLGEGWSRSGTGTLGEMLLAELTAASPLNAIAPEAAMGTAWTNEAASGWDGDAWSVYSSGDRTVTVLATVWDSDKDATEFKAALPGSGGRQAAAIRNAACVVAGDAGERRAALLEACLAAAGSPVEAAPAPGPAASRPPSQAAPAPAPSPAPGRKEDCPQPSPEVVCIQLYAPVRCGACVYSNECFARAAGQDVKLCQRLPEGP